MSEYTVLCIDTEPAVDEVSAAIRAKDQLTPLARTAVEDAIEALETESVDCVVTGYELPDGNGLSVIEAVRDKSPQTPCVLFTAVSPADIETRSFASAGVEYLNREMTNAADRLGFVVEDIITHNTQAGFLLPDDEQSRLEALAEYNVDSLPIEESFDRLTRLIASHFDVDVAFIGLIDRTTEDLIACTGADWEMLMREDTVCTHSMLQDEVMVVEDISEDARFRDNTTLEQLGIVSYAGANITTPGKKTIGQLCLIEYERRTYSETEQNELQAFADLVMEQLELRHTVREMSQMENTT